MVSLSKTQHICHPGVSRPIIRSRIVWFYQRRDPYPLQLAKQFASWIGQRVRLRIWEKSRRGAHGWRTFRYRPSALQHLLMFQRAGSGSYHDPIYLLRNRHR